jgi:hypothetical protein
MDSLSHSGAQCARDCKRKYYYRYERALQARRQVVSDALSLGKAWHQTLAQYWETRDPSAIVLPSDELDQARIRAMMTGYLAKWGEENQGVVCSLSEQRIKAPIRNIRASRSFQQLAITDLVALHRSGRSGGMIWLWEHKTAGRVDEAFLAKLSSDDQITGYGYISALQDNGMDVEGVVYDVVTKLKIDLMYPTHIMPTGHFVLEQKTQWAELCGKKRWKKKDNISPKELNPLEMEKAALQIFEARLTERYVTEPQLYHRERLYIGPQQIEDWRKDLWQTTQEILHCRRAGIWPRNTGRCFDWFSTCEFHPLCINGGSEGLIEAEYEPRTYDDKPKQPAADLPF